MNVESFVILNAVKNLSFSDLNGLSLITLKINKYSNFLDRRFCFQNKLP